MNIPPLISRTPPPLPDDDNDDDDDDEFGHYVIGEVVENGVTDDVYDDFIESATSTGGLNNHSFGSQSAGNNVIPTPGLDFQLDPDQAEQKSLPISTKDEHPSNHPEFDAFVSCSVSNCDSREPENIKTASDRECLKPNGIVVDNVLQENHVPPSEAVANGDVQGDSFNQTDEFGTFERPVTLSDGEFSSLAPDFVANGSISPLNIGDCDEIACTAPIIIAQPESSNCATKTAIAGGSTPNTSTAIQDFDYDAEIDAAEPVDNEDDDDFDDFADFQTSAPDNWKNDEPNTEPDNFEGFSGIVHAQMEDTVPFEGFESRLLDEINANAVWGCLQCLDDTPALKYQWLSSSSNHKLLSALKIDSRNIFCGPWTRSSKSLRLEVSQTPKASVHFADHPSSSHLSSSNLPVSRGSSPNLSFTADPHDKSSVPDPLFDWEGSGLVNPLFYSAKEDRSFDCDTRKGVVENLISVEAQEVLKSLPDLSYMTKTYIAFNSIAVAK